MSQQPPASDSTAAFKPGIADLTFWFTIIECLDVKTIDFEKFAELCNYKNAKSAKKMFYKKRKHMREVQGAGKMGGGKGVTKVKVEGVLKVEGVVKRVIKEEVKEVGKVGVKKEVKEEVEIWGTWA